MFSQKLRVTSGISQLDRLLGGLFIGDNVIWYDEAGSLASVFSLNFIQASQKQNKAFIYVSFDRSPKNLIEELGPLAKNQHLTILDCFTYGKGDGSEVFSRFYEKDGAQWPYQIIKINDPSDPEQVRESIYGVHQTLKGDVRLVFESLTGMQELWGGEEHILKFYARSCPQLYELETIAYWIIEKGAHSNRLKAHINQIAQVAIELSLKRGKSRLTILKADKRRPDNLNKPQSYWNDGLDIQFESGRHSFGAVDIGSRIKEMRTRQGLSQKELARHVGVTSSTISQIESNTIHPSLPALFKIAETLGVDIGSIFQKNAEGGKPPVFTGNGTRVSFTDLPKGSIDGKLLLPMDFDAKAEPYVLEIPPNKRITTHFFMHKGEEMGYVLNGEIQVTINNANYDLKVGDVIYLTSELPSQWSNPGPKTAKMLWIKVK